MRLTVTGLKELGRGLQYEAGYIPMATGPEKSSKLVSDMTKLPDDPGAKVIVDLSEVMLRSGVAPVTVAAIVTPWQAVGPLGDT